MTALPAPLPIPDRPRALATMPEKLAVPDSFSDQLDFRVGHRDLDRNGHVNNVRYIEWALETVPVNVVNTSILDTMDVNFTGEAFHSEAIQARSQATSIAPPTYLHAIYSETAGNELARVKTKWRKLD